MANHTPGPWEAHFWDCLDNRTLEPTGKKRMTIEYRIWPDIKVGRALAELCFESEANARLIARAPSMLALLEKALPIIEAEAEQRKNFPSEDEEAGNYWLDMQGLANEISAEIDRARGKEVKSDVN